MSSNRLLCRSLSAAVFLLIVALVCRAAVIGTNPPAESVTRARIATLPAKERAEWAAYLDRSEAQMKADKARLTAEMVQANLTDPTIPEEGHAARSIPLDKDASWYASPEAQKIADNLISFQVPSGGWSKNIDMAAAPRRPGEAYATNNLSRLPSDKDFDEPQDPAWNYVGTLDNDATITQMQFLAHVTTALGPQKGAPYEKSFLKGVKYLLKAQYPNGGWPQVWPLQGGYHDAVTINDDAMTHVLELFDEIARSADGFAFVPDEMRTTVAASLARGMQCLLDLQISVNGRKTVWAQQYDPLKLTPTSARNYEMPAASSGESAEIVLFLMGLRERTPAATAAIKDAVAWFRKTAIYGKDWRSIGPEGRALVTNDHAAPLWARYYQVGTNKPIFGDRDKTIHDDVSELSRERRNGYAWYGREPQKVLDNYGAWKKSQ